MVAMILDEIVDMLVHLDCTWVVGMYNEFDCFVHVHQMLDIHNETSNEIQGVYDNYDIYDEFQEMIDWNSIHDNRQNDVLMSLRKYIVEYWHYIDLNYNSSVFGHNHRVDH